jgi:hypothetical protein
MPWNRDAAVAYLQSHAEATSHKNCARYVREAIQAGGISLIHTHSAKDYGASLICAGFYPLLSDVAYKGDVIVIQPIPGHHDGHMAMFDGNIWVSDFKQYHGFYPGPGYRSAKPPHKIYRHD